MNIISTSLHRFYHFMQRQDSRVLWYGDESRREIALTFDDGPHPRDTPHVLRALAKHNVRATFFLVGKFAERSAMLVRQIHEGGHQLAMHGYRHRAFLLENSSALQRRLAYTRNMFADICGISPEMIRDVRPPYGISTARITSMLTKWGYRLVMWSSVPPHWMQPFRWTIRQIFDEVIPGSIIVLHDGKGHGSRVPQIVDTIIPRFQARGFQFITIEQMRRNLERKLLDGE